MTHKTRYGVWAGNPQGFKPDLSRCAKEIYSNHHSRQCPRKRTVGDYCWQHDPAAEARRAEASEAAYRAKVAAIDRPYKQREAYRDALRKIADGHNDPCALAREVLAKE